MDFALWTYEHVYSHKAEKKRKKTIHTHIKRIESKLKMTIIILIIKK